MLTGNEHEAIQELIVYHRHGFISYLTLLYRVRKHLIIELLKSNY